MLQLLQSTTNNNPSALHFDKHWGEGANDFVKEGCKNNISGVYQVISREGVEQYWRRKGRRFKKKLTKELIAQ